jgi:hypothetical protein
MLSAVSVYILVFRSVCLSELKVREADCIMEYNFERTGEMTIWKRVGREWEVIN